MSAVLETAQFDEINIVRCKGGPFDEQNQVKADLVHSEAFGFRYKKTSDRTPNGLEIWEALALEPLADHPPKPPPPEPPPPEPLTEREAKAKQRLYCRLRSEFEWSAYERDPSCCGRGEFISAKRLSLTPAEFKKRFKGYIGTDERILYAVKKYESQAFVGARQLQWLLLQIQTQG